VRDVRADEGIDVALVIVAKVSRSTPLSLARAAVGVRWVVNARPLDNDPKLAGSIAATKWKIVNRRASRFVSSSLVDGHTLVTGLDGRPLRAQQLHHRSTCSW
jgi:hypothetical protein